MNYPTNTFVRNLVVCRLLNEWKEQIGENRALEVLVAEVSAPAEGTEDANQVVQELVAKHDLDIDDCVYDVISDFDQYFQGDANWCSASEDEDDCEYDEKDRLRDEVLELLGCAA